MSARFRTLGLEGLEYQGDGAWSVWGVPVPAEPWSSSRPRIRIPWCPGSAPRGRRVHGPLWLWRMSWVTTGEDSDPPSGPGQP